MSRKQMTILLGNAPIRNRNLGCVALSAASLYILDRILAAHGTDYVIWLCDNINYKGRISRESIDVTGREIPYRSCFNAMPGRGREFLNSCAIACIRPGDYARSIGIFRQADVIFDIGLGDSFADIYGKDRFYNIDRIHRIARFLHKPYCFLPQTIGPFRDASVRRCAAKSLEGASMVMTRDVTSLDCVRETAPAQKAAYSCTDVAFFLPYTKAAFDSRFIHVGLNVSALLWHGGYTNSNQFGLCLDYPHAVRSVIGYFLGLPDVVVHLVPHVLGEEKNVENDYWVSYTLCREFKHPRLVLSPFFMSPIDAKEYISGMDFFMGARMHSTIAAFSSCVPVVPMAYSRKFSGLYLDTLNYPYLADMRKDGEERMMDGIRNAFAQREFLKKQEEDRMRTTIAGLGKAMEEHICEFLGLK